VSRDQDNRQRAENSIRVSRSPAGAGRIASKEATCHGREHDTERDEDRRVRAGGTVVGPARDQPHDAGCNADPERRVAYASDLGNDSSANHRSQPAGS